MNLDPISQKGMGFFCFSWCWNVQGQEIGFSLSVRKSAGPGDENGQDRGIAEGV
jgi:hypothetical protein